MEFRVKAVPKTRMVLPPLSGPMAGEIDLTLACAVALVTEAKMMTMKARAVAKKRAGFFERGEGAVARGACNIEVFSPKVFK